VKADFASAESKSGAGRILRDERCQNAFAFQNFLHVLGDFGFAGH
jgi:hypothetical protein